ncbi:MAG: PAS domain S-box protein [Pseudodesulfovibrio sp.]
MFNYLTPITYWLLILIWGSILLFCIKRLRHRKIESAFFATVLFILLIDAARTLFESIYFGAWYTSVAGLLPKYVFEFLIRPELVIIPKLVNLVAAVWIAILLHKKWLPQEEAERLKIEQQIKELEDRTEEQDIIEKALRESEERFRNIVEASPMGMHLYELNAKNELILAGANPAADTILGINHDQLVGKTITEAFPSLEFSVIPDRYKEVCTTGEPWHTEDLNYRDDTSAGAFQIYAFQTLPGRMATQFTDITERKRTEKTLFLTQFTMDYAAVSILWVKPDGSISYFNEAAHKLFDYTREEMTRMGIADLTPDSSIRETVLEKTKAGKNITFEIQARKKDGTLIPVEVTSHYIKFEEEEFEFAFVVDLAERKAAEIALADLNRNLEKLIVERTRDLEQKAVELEDANIRLTEVDRLKSALLSTVTHELKTPLTSIIGYTKLTSRDFEREFLPMVAGNVSLARRGARINENLSVIAIEGARLLGLIDNFLALSKIKAGSNSGQRQPVNVEDALRHAVALSQSSFAAQPDISLLVDIDPDLPTVNGDYDNMVQVVVNLLDNAAKFAGAGEVRLSCARTSKGALRITVKDTGPGIPECEYTNIFEPFHQVCEDEECTIKPDGAGMGLAICKHIVDNFGGTIWLECPDEGGALFIVELPVEDATRNA